jgi:multiple sugar transport system substrate-binding protein
MKKWIILLVSTLLLSISIFAVPTVSIMIQAAAGGVNSQEVTWFNQWIPKIEQDLGIKINLITLGVSEEDFNAKLALEIKGGGGPDIIWLDGFMTPEFASAGYLHSIDATATIPEWQYFYPSMKAYGSYNGKVYNVITDTDVRMIYYNKELFQKAGISVPWQPHSWNDILNTAMILKQKLPGVTPLQLDAGTGMGEATTMQGFYMVLLGAGGNLYDWNTGKWIIGSPALTAAANFYRDVYITDKVGDPEYQLTPGGREQTFKAFQQGKIAMYIEGTWLYTSVMNPSNTSWGIPNRDTIIGWAAMPGRGNPGDPDYVSISGGSGFVINANSKDVALDEEVLKYLFYFEPVNSLFELKPSILPSPIYTDFSMTVNENKFIADTSKLLAYSTYRPALPAYNQVSYQVQVLTQNLVSGMSVDQALKQYAAAVTNIVGKQNVETLP